MSYRELGAGVQVRAEAVDPFARVDLVAFDVDGVLIDVGDSYPEAVSRAVQLFCVERLGWPPAPPVLAPAQTSLWKRAGGFNSDWDVAAAACLYAIWRAETPGAPDMAAFCEQVRRRGGGLAAVLALCGRPPAWDPRLIERLCCELYGGDGHCAAMFGFEPAHRHGPGLCETERPLVRRESLLPWRGRFGVYTGRNDGETAFALERCAIADLVPPDARATCDRGWRKPDPAGLAWLAANLGGRQGLFVGDNVDDCATVRRYRQAGGGPPFLFAGVAGEVPAGLFRELRADLIVPSAETLLAALAVRARPPGA